MFFVNAPELHNKSFTGSLLAERVTLGLHWLWFLTVAWLTPTWSSFFGFILISEAIGDTVS